MNDNVNDLLLITFTCTWFAVLNVMICSILGVPYFVMLIITMIGGSIIGYLVSESK